VARRPVATIQERRIRPPAPSEGWGDKAAAAVRWIRRKARAAAAFAASARGDR